MFRMPPIKNVVRPTVAVPRLPSAPNAMVTISEGDIVWRCSRYGKERATQVGQGRQISYWIDERCIRRFILPIQPGYQSPDSTYLNLWFCNLPTTPVPWLDSAVRFQTQAVVAGTKAGCCVRLPSKRARSFEEMVKEAGCGAISRLPDWDEGYIDVYVFRNDRPLLTMSSAADLQAALDLWRQNAINFRRSAALNSKYTNSAPPLSAALFVDVPLRDAAMDIAQILERKPTQQSPIDLIRCALFFGYPVETAAALIWFRRLAMPGDFFNNRSLTFGRPTCNRRSHPGKRNSSPAEDQGEQHSLFEDYERAGLRSVHPS